MIPFWLPIGHVLTYGKRRMRFEEALGDGILRFRYIDGKEEIVLVPVGRGAALGLPTVEWIIAQFRAGVVTDQGYNAHVTDRNEGYLHLDREACLSIDKKSGWRFDWADAAITDGIIKTEDRAKAWIKANDHGGKKPKPRSLLRWMQKLLLHGRRIGALVSTAGRLKGQSQLSDIEDRLVHKWALHYWRPGSLNGFLAHKDDAAAMMVSEWDILKEMGIPGLGDDAPSSETVRKRINDLEGYSTYASRHGTPAANRKFRASGEPVPIERPFERMYMDGVEWEHSVFYSDEYKIPVAKMRSVITMDGFSQWVAPHPTFAGEFRPQWGLASLRAAMLPPPMTEEEIAEDPERALFYGILADVMYDRDRTMISPRMVPGTIKVVSTAELAQAWHHDAKSKLENYHKFVKQALSKIPGRILGARVKHDIGYNPLKETFVTRAQYVDLIEQCRLQWNSTPKTSLGNRSPDDIMRDFIRSGANRLADPNEVRRTFASTPAKKCQLNKNGLIYDKVHYRHAREDISEALSANYHKTSFAKRIESGATIDVSIRVWDDDLDMIEVFDEARMDYFPMWSTDPGYTGGLNRWEHEIYQKALASMAGRTKRDRLRNKATYLDRRQRSLTGLSFRERREPVEMLEAEERRMSGRRGKNPACAQVPELYVPTVVDGGKREDIPTPPPQTREEEQARREPRLGGTQDAGAAEGAGDVRSDPSKAIARELGDDEASIQPARPDWNLNDVDDDADDDEAEKD